MIKIRYTRDCTGRGKYGHCSSCGKSSDFDSKMVTVKFVPKNGNIFSIHLCDHCRRELYEKI